MKKNMIMFLAICAVFTFIPDVVLSQMVKLPDDLRPTSNVFRFWVNDVETSYLTDYPWVNPGATVKASLWLTGLEGKVKTGDKIKLKEPAVWTLDLVFVKELTGGYFLFEGTVTAPESTIGVYTLNGLVVDCTNGDTIDVFTVYLELSCSDGNFCNGHEYWIDGGCKSLSDDPCAIEDIQGCVTVVCDEVKDICSYILAPGCESCAGCVPDCTSSDGNQKECGTDGCGGLCGGCSDNLGCVDGVCQTVTSLGTCANPLPLIAPGVDIVGRHRIEGDTTQGVFEVVAECNTGSTAPELIYLLSIPAGDPTYGFMAQYTGFDTVLDIKKGSCSGPSLACNDDAYPPGDYGSRVQTSLEPGNDYYFVMSGYSEANFGPFNFFIDIVPNCIPRCNSLYCGDNGCGGDCGPCNDGETCSPSNKCFPDDCIPDCSGKACGDDGCGGECGQCTAPELCVRADGSCVEFPVCNNNIPVCSPDCGDTEYCSSDCTCVSETEPLPDLYVNAKQLEDQIHIEELNFATTDCSVIEGCVSASGVRRVLRFTVETVNQGKGTLHLGDPTLRPDIFAYSPCHGHYHFSGYSNYELLNKTEPYVPVVLGHKQGYCVYDGFRVLRGPAFECETPYSCAEQGIQPGWVDNYGWSLDCQWLDITGIPPGEYLLYVEINYLRRIQESNFQNNIVYVPVTIPPSSGTSTPSPPSPSPPTPTPRPPSPPTTSPRPSNKVCGVNRKRSSVESKKRRT